MYGIRDDGGAVVPLNPEAYELVGSAEVDAQRFRHLKSTQASSTAGPQQSELQAGGAASGSAAPGVSATQNVGGTSAWLIALGSMLMLGAILALIGAKQSKRPHHHGLA